MNTNDEQKLSDEEYDYSNEVIDEDDELSKKDEYLDDDESFLLSDDEIISEDIALSLFKQSNNVIAYEILNFYDDNGKPRNRLALENNPPILNISSSNGESVDFLLTKNFVKSTGALLKDVERAYYGMSPTRGTLARSNFKKIVDWAKNNRVKAVALGIFIALFVGYVVYSSF